MPKLLSIIIPVYNVELYLEQCLDSVFHQVTDDVEVIVINDGSTDNSNEIIKQYKEKYQFIYVNQTNQGLSSARNAGLNELSGEYISFLDSDDVLADGIVEKIITEIVASKIDLYKLKYKKFIDGELLDKHYVSNGNGVLVSQNEIIKDNDFYCWQYIFKRSLFDDVKFDCGRCFEDQLIIPLVIHRALTCKLVDSIIIYYRIRLSSITKQVTLSYIDDALFGLHRYTEKYSEDKIYFSKILAEQYISFLSKCARADHLDHLNVIKTIEKANKLITIQMMINSKNIKAVIFRVLSKIVFYRLRIVTKRDYR